MPALKQLGRGCAHLLEVVSAQLAWVRPFRLVCSVRNRLRWSLFLIFNLRRIVFVPSQPNFLVQPLVGASLDSLHGVTK